MLLTSCGLAIGIAVASGATRALRTLLYEVQPGDPATYAVLTAVLCAVSLAASFIPAWRATRVDALQALRSE